MNKRTILTLIESIENDLKYTSEEIQRGKHYQLYFNDLLKAKYDFMQYLNENENMGFDLEYIKERDKEKYSI